MDRTYGGDGLKYAGSSGERGKDVEISIIVDESLNKRDIVTASRGLVTGKFRYGFIKRNNPLTWRAIRGYILSS